MANTTKELLEQIVSEEAVVHPSLDWRDGVLMMGVMLKEGQRGILTSRREIFTLEDLPFPICERGGNFSRSPFGQAAARQFIEGYGLPDSSESAYALVDIPARLAAYYRRFVVFPEPWWPDVLALWTLGTYLYPVFSSYPYLRISSPEPGCGKSSLGDLISKLSFNGELLASPTEANVFRLGEAERGTQVWDEVENEHDVERNRLQMMKAVLLNGYRSGGVVLRQERGGEKGQFESVRFHVFVPRVLIGLSELPPVVRQRTIELVLQRRSGSEPIERYRADEHGGEEAKLREQCALWALTYCEAVAGQHNREGLVERLERYVGQVGRVVDDLLFPLVAVAGGPIDGDQRSRGQLLPLVKTLFGASRTLSQDWRESGRTTPAWLSAAIEALQETNRLTPAQLADVVASRTGDPITAERLAHRLKPYGIRSSRVSGVRVYEVPADQLAQIRDRYSISTSEPELDGPLVEVRPPDGQTGQIGQIGQQNNPPEEKVYDVKIRNSDEMN